MEASRYLGKKEYSIYKCCNGTIHSAYGFCWSYSPTFNPKPLKTKKHHNNGVAKYDSNGNKLEKFSTIKEAADKNKVSSCSISLCCSGKIKSVKGFIWKYEGE